MRRFIMMRSRAVYTARVCCSNNNVFMVIDNIIKMREIYKMRFFCIEHTRDKIQNIITIIKISSSRDQFHRSFAC